jgi:acetyl-CoA carboxylase biotin carboxyl carrier protein
MHRYDLTAVDLSEGTKKIRLRRRREPLGGASAPSHPVAPQAAAATPADAGTTPPAAKTAADLFIESPMVGTFYSSSAPEALPFVTIGSGVRPETIVCVLEAMKVFTDIPAGVAGTIAEVLVKNGQPVEYGQPLFRVEPA